MANRRRHESFKHHGHLYLAILNLATQLSSHSVVQTLMNTGKFKNRDKSKSNAAQVNIKQPSHSEQRSKQEVSDLWKKLAAAALSDYARPSITTKERLTPPRVKYADDQLIHQGAVQQKRNETQSQPKARLPATNRKVSIERLPPS